MSQEANSLPAFYSPLERKIYRILSERGEDGATIHELRMETKTNVQPGTMRNTLINMRNRGLVVQNQFTRERDRIAPKAERADVYQLRVSA